MSAQKVALLRRVMCDTEDGKIEWREFTDSGYRAVWQGRNIGIERLQDEPLKFFISDSGPMGQPAGDGVVIDIRELSTLGGGDAVMWRLFQLIEDEFEPRRRIKRNIQLSQSIRLAEEERSRELRIIDELLG